MDQWESGLGSDPSGTCSPIVVRIRIEESMAAARTHELRKFPVVLGRVPQNDLHVDDPWTSVVQCLFDVHGRHVIVRDLETRRGTIVNGLSIFRHRLRPGDVIEVGTTRLIVESIAPQDSTRAAHSDTGTTPQE